jgi:hypothetical protein
MPLTLPVVRSEARQESLDQTVLFWLTTVCGGWRRAPFESQAMPRRPPPSESPRKLTIILGGVTVHMHTGVQPSVPFERLPA